MKLFVAVLATSLVAYATSDCLRGWDITLALRETKLNQALMATTLLISKHTIPTVNQDAGLTIDPAAGWGSKTTISMVAFKINQLQLHTVDGQPHEAQLAVGFWHGGIRISTELVKADGTPFGVPPSVSEIPVANSVVKFRVRVTAYQLNFENTGGRRYSIRLEIVQEDAIIGHLDWNVPLLQVASVRGALTEMMKRQLKEGTEYHLADFDIPAGFDKKLMPKEVRFATIYVANQQSVFAGLITTSTQPTEGGFNWKSNDLIPDGKDAALKISANKFLEMMKPSIVDSLDVDTSQLSVRGSCPKTLEVNQEIGNWKEGATLKEGKISFHEGTNRIGIYIRMYKKISPGISVTIKINMDLQITYNSGKQKFEIEVTNKSHSTKYHKDWWVVLLEVVTLGIGSIVTSVIQIVADNIIKKAVNTSLNIGPGTGTELVNIDGVAKEIFKNLQVGGVNFSGGNFVMDFSFFNRK